MKSPRRPTLDSPIDLQWAWDVCDAIRERTPLSFYGFLATLSPAGFSLVAPSLSLAAVVAIKKAFDIKELSTSSMTVTRCWYMRQSVAVFREDEPSVSLSGTETMVSACIHKKTGAVTLEAGTAPYDASTNKVAEYYRRPIYRLKRVSESSNWHIDEDLRSMLSVGLYE